MKAYIAFTKKEFCEFTRTYKLLIINAVFLLLGIMNPITAKVTPMLLKEFMPKGIEITLGTPTAIDSFSQFYKNVPQMGLIILVILFSGIMANELSNGTLINVLTKGLPRQTVILSKFTMAVSMWTLAYSLCFVTTYAYTLYFFSSKGIEHILFSAICVWIFGILLIAAILLSSIITASNYGCLLMTGLFVAALFLLNIVPKIQEHSPLALITKNMALLTDQMVVKDFLTPIIVSIVIIITFLMTSIFFFNKKKL